jgi:hypothetical protein
LAFLLSKLQTAEAKTVTEIMSWNELFSEAKRRNLRMNNFVETRDGRFSASWRRDNPEQHFPPADHEQPFLALLNAFVLADLTASVEAPAGVVVDSLFE